MDDSIVRRVEWFAVECGPQHGLGAVVFVAHDAAVSVLAGDLPAPIVERVAVAVAAGFAENGHAVVVLDPAQLQVVRDVAENKIPADTVPGAALGPKGVRAGVEPLNRRVADLVFVEARVERNEVGIGIARRVFASPIPSGCGGQASSSNGCGGEKIPAIDVVLFHDFSGINGGAKLRLAKRLGQEKARAWRSNSVGWPNTMTDQFPQMFRVRQRFDVPQPVDVAALVADGFGTIRGQLKPGMRVAVGVGSRGISNLANVVAAVIGELKLHTHYLVCERSQAL